MIERNGKRIRRQGVRLEEFLSMEDSHPYGCLPGGNRFFVDDEEFGGSKATFAGGDERRWCSDELWQDVLGFCDVKTLGRVTAASRYLYVAGHQPELWRDLVLRRCDEENRIVDATEIPGHRCPIKSWKDMYLALFVSKPTAGSGGNHAPKQIPGMYSDEYYRTHRCRSFSIPKSWLNPNLTAAEDTIPSIAMESITPDQFFQDFEDLNRPVVIKGAAKSTTASQKWSDPSYLTSTNIHKKSFRTTSGAAPLPVNFTLEAYQTYSNFSYLEESPLYLFDRTAFDNPRWHQDFFPEFYRNCPFWNPSAQYGHDLLQYLGAAERPDHTWMIMGPKRSGSVFHIDPNATHAWNACILGRKRWIFYPPGCPPPGVFPSEDGDEVAIPLSVGEWLLQYWSEHVERMNSADMSRRPTECTVYPGDVIFVPHGYWHMVINLDDTNCAITHNYVSPSNLGNVLKFFVDKQDQISGCRDRYESIKPEHLHDAVVEALAKNEPQILQKAQQQEEWSCRAWKDKSKCDAFTITDKNEASVVPTLENRTSVMAKTERVPDFSFSFL